MTGHRPEPAPGADPWQALARIVAGVVLYGGLGWLADRALGTTYVVAVGVVLGFVLGTYTVVKSLGHTPSPDTDSVGDARAEAMHTKEPRT